MTDHDWSSGLAKILVKWILEQVRKGNKEWEWRLICDEFCGKTGMILNVEQLKNQYAILRKQYLIVKSIFDQDDFSWHESRSGIIVATEDRWSEYMIRAQLGCPTYKELCIIFSDSDGGQETSQPASSNSRKRGRKSIEYATYTIADCIKGLDKIDEMHGLEEDVYFGALQLFNQPNARETFLCLNLDKRYKWLQRNWCHNLP